MKDTPPDVEAAYDAMFSRLSGTERLRLASDMFETAKALVIADIRAAEPDISPAALRVRLFERLYDDDFDEPLRAAIVAALSEPAGDAAAPEPALQYTRPAVTTATRPDRPLIAKLQDALRSGPSLRLAVLFGSAATGATRPDSDIDVAILPDAEGMDAAVESALFARLAGAGGADVDLVRLDAPPSTLLGWQIATTGVPLFESGPGEWARFRAEAAAEYIDFAPALAHHGEIFRRRLAARAGNR